MALTHSYKSSPKFLDGQEACRPRCQAWKSLIQQFGLKTRGRLSATMRWQKLARPSCSRGPAGSKRRLLHKLAAVVPSLQGSAPSHTTLGWSMRSYGIDRGFTCGFIVGTTLAFGNTVSASSSSSSSSLSLGLGFGVGAGAMCLLGMAVVLA